MGGAPPGGRGVGCSGAPLFQWAMNKLPARFTPVVLSFWMSLLMAGLMSLIVTAINTGIDPGLLHRWGWAFLKVWPIAFVALFLLRPLAMRLTAWWVEGP